MHLNRLHHAFVFVFHHVTMKHKAPHHFRVGKRNDHFSDTGFSVPDGRNAEGVTQAVEMRGDAIDLGDQKSSLMNMEIVVLRIFV